MSPNARPTGRESALFLFCPKKTPAHDCPSLADIAAGAPDMSPNARPTGRESALFLFYPKKTQAHDYP
jgi:hypothetical protein